MHLVVNHWIEGSKARINRLCFVFVDAPTNKPCADNSRALGADHVFKAADYTPGKLKEVNQGCLADTVIVCTGAFSAYSQAIASVEPGGTILVFAPTAPDVTVPLSLNDFFWRRETTITTSYAGSPADHEAALELIRTGNLPLEQLITHRLPLSGTGLGFKLVNEARDSIKVIIEPWKD